MPVLMRLSWLVADVVEVVPETARVKTLRFDVDGWPGHLPGQHVDVRLTAEDGYQAERSYSVASAPNGTQIDLTVERIDDGEVSPYLTEELRLGDQIELRGPVGGYFVWEPGRGGPLLLIGGGSGVVPLMAMLRYRAASDSDVRNASARVRDTYLTYARTKLPAPVGGFVAKRAVQLGQRVSPGTPLMAIGPLDQVWVDANYKEPQLAAMRLGQPVTLRADLYGGKVRYHGTVSGFGAGTGSAFALLPAQNATGNWIKIVQRVPVRIALDPQELAAHPLQIGLSMQVEVDTHDRSGDRLPQLAQSAPAYATEVFRLQEEIAEQRVKAIIAANQGEASRLAQGRGREDATSERFAQSDRAKSTTAATGRAGTVN